jgi:hypothetical protein
MVSFKSVPVKYGWSVLGHSSVKHHNVFYLWVPSGLRERIGDSWVNAVKDFSLRVIKCFLRYALFRVRTKKAVRKIRITRVVAQLAPQYPEHLARYITDYIM